MFYIYSNFVYRRHVVWYTLRISKSSLLGRKDKEKREEDVKMP